MTFRTRKPETDVKMLNQPNPEPKPRLTPETATQVLEILRNESVLESIRKEGFTIDWKVLFNSFAEGIVVKWGAPIDILKPVTEPLPPYAKDKTVPSVSTVPSVEVVETTQYGAIPAQVQESQVPPVPQVLHGVLQVPCSLGTLGCNCDLLKYEGNANVPGDVGEPAEQGSSNAPTTIRQDIDALKADDEARQFTPNWRARLLDIVDRLEKERPVLYPYGVTSWPVPVQPAQPYRTAIQSESVAGLNLQKSMVICDEVSAPHSRNVCLGTHGHTNPKPYRDEDKWICEKAVQEDGADVRAGARSEGTAQSPSYPWRLGRKQ